MKKGTLSSKLFIRIVPTIIATILLIGGLAFYSAYKEINTVYDAQLISNANVLWTLVYDEIKEEDKDGELDSPKKIDDIDLESSNQVGFNDSADDYADSRMFRVWKSGKINVYSDTALPSEVPKQAVGFSDVLYKNEKWRIYSLPIANSDITIEIGEKIYTPKWQCVGEDRYTRCWM